MRDPILILGKYEIIEPIGSGGMATVYRARMAGPMGFEKPVAIKVLHEEVTADDDVVRMFIDEARVGARLGHHPNIASILDFGEADGRYFIAMEYVDGVSLATLLKKLGKGRKGKGLELAVAGYITYCVLQALAAAHGAKDENGKSLNVVHRDVSPQNVLLDRSGSVKLCDFGIATGSYRTEKTRFGIVKGKAAYMSPEQASGGRVDGRSDIYSAGLTMMAMLTGGPIFDGKDTADVRAEAAKGVDQALVSALDIPEPIREVLRKALEIRPSDRFQSADEFAAALLRAIPDCMEKGRKALMSLVGKVSENGASNALRKARPAAAAKIPIRKDPSRALRNLLLAAGVVFLLALIFALLRLKMPQP